MLPPRSLSPKPWEIFVPKHGVPAPWSKKHGSKGEPHTGTIEIHKHGNRYFESEVYLLDGMFGVVNFSIRCHCRTLSQLILRLRISHIGQAAAGFVRSTAATSNPPTTLVGRHLQRSTATAGVLRRSAGNGWTGSQHTRGEGKVL
jgi:hypothetical protein